MQTIRRNVFTVRTGGHVGSDESDDLAVKLHKVMAKRGGRAALRAAMDAILEERDDEIPEDEQVSANSGGLPPMGRLLTNEPKRDSGPLRPHQLLTAPPSKKVVGGAK